MSYAEMVTALTRALDASDNTGGRYAYAVPVRGVLEALRDRGGLPPLPTPQVSATLTP